MTTFAPSMLCPTTGATLLREGSRARTSPSPTATERGWEAKDRPSGSQCWGSLDEHDPLTSLSRTVLTSSIWGSKFVSLAWSRTVTPQGRLLFRLRGWARGTSGNGASSLPSGLVPTITAWEANRAAGRPSHHKAYSTTKNGTVRWRNKKGSTSFVGLAPTLRAMIAKPESKFRAKHDGHRSNIVGWIRDSESDPVYLNPSFAETFMGYPKDWTA